MKTKWTQEDWVNWRAENMRLTLAGWVLSTIQFEDGHVEEWAEKDGFKIRRDPNWERDDEGNYIYEAPSA